MSAQYPPSNDIASPSLTSPSPTLSVVSAFANIPLELLRAELRRRQDEEGDHGAAAAAPSTQSPAKPTCGTKGGVQSEYNVTSHVFALILILVLSTVACAFPILARRFPRLPIPHHFLFLSRHFGTGVLIATAFVHLLPTAFHSLSDPCLPDFWTKRYTPMPGLVAMVAVLVVVGIEMFFASQGAGHVHGSDFDQPPGTAGGASVGRKSFGARQETEQEDDEYEFGTTGQKRPRLGRGSRPRGYSEMDMDDEEEGAAELHRDDIGMSELDKLHGAEQEEWGQAAGVNVGASSAAQEGQARPLGRDSQDDGESDEDMALDLHELDPANAMDADDADLIPSGRTREEQKVTAHQRNQSHISHLSTASASLANTSPALAKRLLLQCVLLEAGILFHSVFIGMAVSVARGPQFAVLLVAIAFHQTFEGFALGARISAIVPLLPPGSSRPWLMALAYGATTPIGQAIGLAIHGLYDPKSEVGLILVGCMNAISSGLLLFAGLVELLAEDFLSESSYKTLRGRRRAEACACVVAGAFLMAGVGAFA